MFSMFSIPSRIFCKNVGICWLVGVFKLDALTILDRHFFRTVAGEDQEVSIDRFVEGCMDPASVAECRRARRFVFSIYFNLFQ